MIDRLLSNGVKEDSGVGREGNPRELGAGVTLKSWMKSNRCKLKADYRGDDTRPTTSFKHQEYHSCECVPQPTKLLKTTGLNGRFWAKEDIDAHCFLLFLI